MMNQRGVSHRGFTALGLLAAVLAGGCSGEIPGGGTGPTSSGGGAATAGASSGTSGKNGAGAAGTAAWVGGGVTGGTSAGGSGAGNSATGGMLSGVGGMAAAGAGQTAGAPSGGAAIGGASGGGAASVEGIGCEKSSKVDGVKLCETSLDGIKIKYVPPPTPAALTHVGFYFHGDTGWEYDSGLVFVLNEWAATRDTVFFVLKSPYEAGAPGDRYISWKGLTLSETASTGDVLAQVASAYGVAPNKTLFVGVSGGSAFLLNAFIPRQGNRFPALYAANCGAGDTVFGDAGTWDPDKDIATRSAIRLRFTYGSKDWASYGMEFSADYYERRGFVVERREIDQGNQSPQDAHCDFDTEGESLSFFAAQLEP